MTIALDIRMYNNSGIGVYLKNLLNCYDSIGKANEFLLIAKPEEIVNIEGFKKFYYFNQPIYSLSEQFKYPIQFKDVDLLHYPHYAFPLKYKGKIVITIHDLNHILFKNKLWEIHHYFYAKYMLLKAIKRADAIIVGSNFIKNSLINIINAPAEKINVVYYGIGDHFKRCDDKNILDNFKKKYSLPSRYLLTSGINKPHKNFSFLIDCYSELIKENKTEIPLVIAGMSNNKKDDLISQIKNYNLEKKIIFCPYIDDAEMPLLYSGAEVFVYPSLYEGFGLPLAEAMACGVPIASSNSEPMPEVLCDAALFFDPKDKAAFKKTIVNLLGDTSLKNILIEKGYNRAKDFSMRSMAEKTYSVYKKVI